MNLHGANDAFVAQRPIAEYSRSFFPVLAVVLVLRSFLVEPFQIPSSSMVPTLEVGDYILVNKFSYGLRLPVIENQDSRYRRAQARRCHRVLSAAQKCLLHQAPDRFAR